MMGLFKQFFLNVYVALRGNTTVHVTKTDNVLDYHYSVLNLETKTEEKYIDLICHQFKHDVIYEEWWIPNRHFYTYRVEVIFIKDVSNISQFPHYDFPHLCLKSLHDTKYPHMCAINAYLDNSTLVWSKRQNKG